MKYRLLCCLCLGAMLLTGCSAKEKNQEPTQIPVYEALPLPDIKVDIPEGYETTSSELCEEFYKKDDASIIITEDKNGPFDSTYDYSITALKQYQQVAATVEVLSNDTVDCVNASVQTLEFRYTLGENAEADMTVLAGYVTDGQSMFIVTCKSNTSTYAEHRDEFFTVMKSLMLTTTGYIS
ncbi:MAG: hypothetical protein K5695_10765 [Oscillospiraceae bacterium]|nr:hypothetical protein [Oscillospiraceae bacterium]